MAIYGTIGAGRIEPKALPARVDGSIAAIKTLFELIVGEDRTPPVMTQARRNRIEGAFELAHRYVNRDRYLSKATFNMIYKALRD